MPPPDTHTQTDEQVENIVIRHTIAILTDWLRLLRLYAKGKVVFFSKKVLCKDYMYVVCLSVYAMQSTA